MNCALLMSGENVSNLILIFIKGIINIYNLTAGIAENAVALLLYQNSDNYVSTR